MTTSWATFLMSISGKIIDASLPPSSNVTRLSVWEHASITFLPVGIEPVKVILDMSGCRHSCLPSSSLPPMACTTPGGKVACISSTSLRPA